MAQTPDTIALGRDRDLQGRRHQIWIRRGLFAIVCAIPALALANVFGQQPQTSAGTAEAARLSIFAPSRLRLGLLYQARFRVTARRDLHRASLVLDRGWLEGMTINTIEPSPASQSSANGKLALDLGPISAGQTYALFLDFQVNPISPGRRNQTVTLYDGNRSLITIHRSIRVFP